MPQASASFNYSFHFGQTKPIYISTQYDIHPSVTLKLQIQGCFSLVNAEISVLWMGAVITMHKNSGASETYVIYVVENYF